MGDFTTHIIIAIISDIISISGDTTDINNDNNITANIRCGSTTDISSNIQNNNTSQNNRI